MIPESFFFSSFLFSSFVFRFFFLLEPSCHPSDQKSDSRHDSYAFPWIFFCPLPCLACSIFYFFPKTLFAYVYRFNVCFIRCKQYLFFGLLCFQSYLRRLVQVFQFEIYPIFSYLIYQFLCLFLLIFYFNPFIFYFFFL